MPSSALMIRRPPRSTLSSSSAASDVYKRQDGKDIKPFKFDNTRDGMDKLWGMVMALSLIHISEPTRLLSISYAVFCFNDTATTEIYTILFVGSVRCV